MQDHGSAIRISKRGGPSACGSDAATRPREVRPHYIGGKLTSTPCNKVVHKYFSSMSVVDCLPSRSNAMSVSASVFYLAAPGIPKRLSRARQTRHDGADRQGSDIRNLTIGELFEFAQDEYFAQRTRHHIKNEANGPGFCFAQQHRFRIVLVGRYIKDEL